MVQNRVTIYINPHLLFLWLHGIDIQHCGFCAGTLNEDTMSLEKL